VLVVEVIVAEHIMLLITSMSLIVVVSAKSALAQRLMIHILLLMMLYRSVFTQAGIEKLHVEGRIRITFDPLVDKLPVIGAVKVSRKEQI